MKVDPVKEITVCGGGTAGRHGPLPAFEVKGRPNSIEGVSKKHHRKQVMLTIGRKRGSNLMRAHRLNSGILLEEGVKVLHTHHAGLIEIVGGPGFAEVGL